MKSRSNALRTIREGLVDVCIIGGGAKGMACALDAQLRGLSIVLLDAADFVSHTSSASKQGKNQYLRIQSKEV
jgi:glycerol-3-phosphate dehydrogenase